MQEKPDIVLDGVGKSFVTPRGPLEILKDVSTEICCQQKVAIVGPSGSGKSTLLALLAGLEYPTTGSITTGGTSLSTMNEKGLADYRNRTIGIVFQSFELIVPFTVEENVSAPLDIAGRHDPERVTDLIERVGLSERRHAYPQTLSGGGKRGQEKGVKEKGVSHLFSVFP